MLRICYRLGLGVALLTSAVAAEQRVASDYRAYTIRLTHWRPVNSQTAGVLVGVRINSGRTLRLVLDTGASGITLNRKAGRGLGLQAMGEAVIVGLSEARTVTTALARSVQVGELEIADCPVQVSSGDLVRDADGVIGMNVFEDFRIRLDAGARELRLDPFPERPLHARPSAGHLLFVKARVNGDEEGLFLVDTGSAVTSLASDVRWPAQSGKITLNGASGSVECDRLAPVSLEIAGKHVVERNAVALNLDSVSRRNGIRVTGILGYSLLSRTPVTVDYREGLVAFK